jgi:DNA-binding cell septation regulator SpoVG
MDGRLHQEPDMSWRCCFCSFRGTSEGIAAALVAKEVRITDVRFTPSTAEDVAQGLLGWVSATLNGALRLDGISLRRISSDGRIALSFPARRDQVGRDHPYIRPLGDAARREIERQVFAALGLATEAIR